MSHDRGTFYITETSFNPLFVTKFVADVPALRHFYLHFYRLAVHELFARNSENGEVFLKIGQRVAQELISIQPECQVLITAERLKFEEWIRFIFDFTSQAPTQHTIP